MATSMAEDLMCSVCLSLFREPHMLRCGHNFCLSCLENCIPGGQSTGKCPECRSPFSRPEFTCNRALANLAEKARRLRLDRESLPPAVLVGFCEEHDEPLKLFCRQDLVPICVICRDLPQHQGHDFLPTKDAVKYTKEKLEPYKILVESNLRDVTKDHMDQMEEMEKLETGTEEILSCISKEFESLRQILHEKEQGFKKTVEEMKAKNLKEMEDALHSLKEKVSSNTETNDKITTALEMADHFAFLMDFKDLMERVQEFQPWMAKEDDANLSEELDEEEHVNHSLLLFMRSLVWSNKGQLGCVDEVGEISKEEDEDPGDGEVSEEEDKNSGDVEASKGEDENPGDGEVSEEEDEDPGDGEVSKEEDENPGDGQVSKEEDEDSGDGELSEKEEEEEGEEDARIYGKTAIPVCSALKTFMDTLDFEAWKEMLERIQPKQL